MKYLLCLIMITLSVFFTRIQAQNSNTNQEMNNVKIGSWVMVALDFSECSLEKQSAFSLGLQTTLVKSDIPITLIWFENLFVYRNLDDERALHDAAVRSGCRFTISAKVKEVNSEATAFWVIRDIRLKIDYPEQTSKMKDYSSGNLIDFFWMEVFHVLSEAIQIPVPDDYLNIYGMPGSKITGLSDKVLILDASGHVAVPINVPGSYIFISRLNGYLPSKTSILVDRPGMEFTIDLEKLEKFDFEFGLFQMQFPDFKFRYWIPKSPIFISAGLEQFFIGLVLIENRNDYDKSPPFWSGIPLFQPSAGFGINVTPARSPLNLLLEAEFFIRIFIPKKKFPSVDPVLPFGVRVNFCAVQKLSQHLSLFAQIGPTIYPFADTELAMASNKGDGPFSPFILGETICEPFSIRLGIQVKVK